MFGRRRPRRLAELHRATIAVQLTSGRTIAGILLGEYEDVIAIARGRGELRAGEGMMPLDGELLIPLDRIEYVQVGVKIDDADAKPTVKVEAA